LACLFVESGRYFKRVITPKSFLTSNSGEGAPVAWNVSEGIIGTKVTNKKICPGFES
jgi:hypothetical protein